MRIVHRGSLTPIVAIKSPAQPPFTRLASAARPRLAPITQRLVAPLALGRRPSEAEVLHTALLEAAEETGLPNARVEFLDPNNRADIEATGKLLADVFLRLEPMTVHLAQQDPSLVHVMHAFSQLYAADVAAHGLTPVVRNEQGKIVALLMAEPYDAEAPPPPIPALEPVFAVLGKLTEAFSRHRANNPTEFHGPLLHLAMAATDPDEQTSPNTGTALLKAIITKVQMQAQLSPRHAYTHMVAEATSLGSQGVLRLHFRFRKVVSEAYANHPEFANIARPASAVLMLKSLQEAKGYAVPKNIRRTRQTLRLRFEQALQAAQSSPLVDAVRALPPAALQEFVQAVAEARTECLKPAPRFGPVYDNGTLRAMRAAADAGMPIFDNGILAPSIPAGNWPYHFKAEELAVVHSAAQQAGVRDPTTVHGYVCDRNEANRYGIRALKSRFEAEDSGSRPVVLASLAAHPSVPLAAESLGLSYVGLVIDTQGAVDPAALSAALQHGILQDARRPIILIVTLGAESGAFDPLVRLSNALAEAGRRFLIHVDAARSFDFLSRDDVGSVQMFTLNPTGVSQTLLHRPVVHSLVAGGLSTHTPQYVTALCHESLDTVGKHVAYLRGQDTTLAGSRPAVAGLSAYLLQQRFKPEARAAMATRANEAAAYLQLAAPALQLLCVHPQGSLDIALCSSATRAIPQTFLDTWGLRRHGDRLLLTVQPSVRDDDLKGLLTELAGVLQLQLPTGLLEQTAVLTPFEFGRWRVGAQVRRTLRETVNTLRNRDNRPSGYPGNHATLDLLAPVLEPFLTLPIPAPLAAHMAAEVVGKRLLALGVTPGDPNYAGSITTGSTVSIHSGLINALRMFKNETVRVYLSADAHYSGAKICADHAELAHRVQIVQTNAAGQMSPDALVKHLQADREQEPGSRAVLLATHGTTFSGAVDDVGELLRVAAAAGQAIDYVHVDGALDLGTSMGPYRLAKPGTIPSSQGDLVRVQSVSISNHKFPGVKVSGLSLAVLPQGESHLPVVGEDMDLMATLQLWAYDSLIDGPTGERIRAVCERNTDSLRQRLQAIGERVQGAKKSLITVINRPSNLITNQFLLAPEGDKSHFIAMPHLRDADLDAFVEALRLSKARAAQSRQALSAALHPLELRGEVVDVTMDAATQQQVARLLVGDGPAAAQQERALHNAFANGDALAALARDSADQVVAVVLMQRIGDAWRVFGDAVDSGVKPAWQTFISEQLLRAVTALDISMPDL